MIARIGIHQIDTECIEPEFCFFFFRSVTAKTELRQKMYFKAFMLFRPSLNQPGLQTLSLIHI